MKEIIDNEIIKALECCNTAKAEHRCDICPFYEDERCTVSMLDSAVDLINRQKAEIERLTALFEAAEDYLKPLPFKNAFDEEIEKTKIEAIKKFAERLKNKSELLAPSVYAELFRAVSVEDIDTLVKEMTESEDT